MTDPAMTEPPRSPDKEANLYQRIRARVEPLGGIDLESQLRTLDCAPTRSDIGKSIPEVYDLRRTCIACPSQWEGRINDHGSIYIRYRWGTLSVRISMNDANAVDAETCFYEEEYDRGTGDRLGGYMDTCEMRKLLEGICHFNGECDGG